MTTLTVIALLVLALVIAYLLLEKRPGYGVYYGLAKLTGARLDIGPVDWATLTAPHDAERRAGLSGRALPEREAGRGTEGLRHHSGGPAGAAESASRWPSRISASNPCAPNCDRTARFIQYTRLMRFPDTIDVQVLPVGDNQSTLAIYSRSLVGRNDFGVNRARVERWLAALG